MPIFAVCLIALVGFGLLAGWQSHLDKQKVPLDTLAEMQYLPDGKLLNATSFGFKPLIADVLWVKSLMYVSSHFSTDRDFTWLYKILDIVTEFDPYFVRAYQYGGFLLTSVSQEPQEAITLMRKGIENNPEAWRLQYELAHIYKFYADDIERSAEMFEKAAETARKHGQDTQIFMEQASDYYTRAGSYDRARLVWQNFAKSSNSADMRDIATFQLKKLNAEEIMELLTKGIKNYKAQRGIFPANLETLAHSMTLVNNQPIRTIPKDPWGEPYNYDPATGNISCMTLLRKQHHKRVHFLQGSIDMFKIKYGHYPKTLDELVEKRAARSIGESPLGRPFQYDPETGRLN